MTKKSDKKGNFDFLGTIEKLKPGLKDETVHAVFAVLFFIAGVIFVLAALGKAGMAGNGLYSLLNLLFGVGYFLLPILFFILGISSVRSIKPDVAAPHIIGSLLFLISGLGRRRRRRRRIRFQDFYKIFRRLHEPGGPFGNTRNIPFCDF